MMYVGYAYNLITLCVLVMSIGFCVDYSVRTASIPFHVLSFPSMPFCVD